MTNLCTIIEFMQNLCIEKQEFNNMFKEIDKLSKENMIYENQLKELDREHLRLQIEIHNLETIIFQDNNSAKDIQQTSIKMYKDSIELRNLIERIDFTKILQCYHMEMEAKCRKEWQPIEDCFVKTFNWHEQMAQRTIVLKYRKAEIIFRETDEAYKNEQVSIVNSTQKSLQLIKQAKERRNELILFLIKGSKYFDDFKAKMEKINVYQVYIEELRQEKSMIESQLKKTHFQALNPVVKFNNSEKTTKLKQNTEGANFITPKLPSFTDILQSFNHAEEVNVNTTPSYVKSILHTSKSNQSTTTKQSKNVRFKVELEEYQETIENIYNSDKESERDVDIKILPTQAAIDINDYQEKKNLQEMPDLENNAKIEIVDVSTTPTNDLVGSFEGNQEVMDSSANDSNIKNQIDKNSPVEVQECIIFKTPFPIQEVLSTPQHKQNILSITASCSQESTDTHSSKSLHSDIKGIMNSTKKSYKEFLNASYSAGESASAQIESNSGEMEGFDMFLNDKNDFLFSTKESKQDVRVGDTFNNFDTRRESKHKRQDFLDFGSGIEFTFDSDDNMPNNYEGTMDFM